MSKYGKKVSLPVNFEGLINARCPQDVCVFFDDFVGASWSATDNAAKWFFTPVKGAIGGVLTARDGTSDTLNDAYGNLQAVLAASADDGVNLQVPGEHFQLDEDSYPLYFEARINNQDISNLDLFVGLSITDAEILTGGTTDRIGFDMVAGVLNAISEKDSSEKTTDVGATVGITETDDYWYRVAFYFDGDDTITFLVDGNDDGEFDFVTQRKISTTADYIPDNEMLTPTIEMITGASAEADTGYVDYVFVAQQRYHA